MGGIALGCFELSHARFGSLEALLSAGDLGLRSAKLLFDLGQIFARQGRPAVPFIEAVPAVPLAGPAFGQRLITSGLSSATLVTGLFAVAVFILEAGGAVHMQLAHACLRVVMLCCRGVRRGKWEACKRRG